MTTISTTATKEPAISLRDVNFSYGMTPIVKNAQLNIKSSEAVCLTGENGCGKSTLLKLVIGELKPDEGQVQVQGKAVGSRMLELGYVPQSNVISKTSFPITSREIVVQGLSHEFGLFKIPRKRHYARADEALARMGLEAYAHYPFGELSGGLRQRVMITRALINEPTVLILDEPISGVDKQSRETFLQMIDGLNQQEGLTILLVTHDVATVSANMNIDQLYELKEGSVVRV